jgi:hypothetical protein
MAVGLSQGGGRSRTTSWSRAESLTEAHVLALILNIHISLVQVVQLLMLLGAGCTYTGGH